MRKKLFIIPALAALMLAAAPLRAQEKVEIFGYFESQFLGTKVSSRFYQLFTNKLRVDLKSRLSDSITFAANFDYITYHGKTRWNILEFLAPNISDAIPDEMRALYVIPFENESFLDNAYMKFSHRYFDLTAGKQQISLGTGYVWNPLDVFNIKDVLDPTYEQPGHNAVRLDVPLSASSTVTALYSPDAEWGESAKLLQFKGQFLGFDFSAIVIEKLWRFHDYARFDFARMNFLELPEKRRLWGGSTAGELLGLGVWAEFAYNDMESSDDFTELVVGGDYTFDFQTYVMCEYYRNTLGKSDYREYDITDWMRLFAQEQKSITRDQVYALIQHPVTDLMNLGLSGVLSISDGSLALVPTLIYSLSDNVDIFAYLNINIGREGKAYGKSTGNGGLIRARVYF